MYVFFVSNLAGTSTASSADCEFSLLSRRGIINFTNEPITCAKLSFYFFLTRFFFPTDPQVIRRKNIPHYYIRYSFFYLSVCLFSFTKLSMSVCVCLYVCLCLSLSLLPLAIVGSTVSNVTNTCSQLKYVCL